MSDQKNLNKNQPFMNTKMYQLGERKYYEMIQELGILSYFFEKTGWSKIYKFFKFLINLTYKMY